MMIIRINNLYKKIIPFKDYTEILKRHPTRKWKKRTSSPSHIILHCSASNNQSVELTNHYHITPGKDNHISSKGCPRIAYSDLIDKTGNVFHCNDYDDITWHARSFNDKSIGVCLMYSGKGLPDQIQYESMIFHTANLCILHKIPPYNIMGHREVPGMYEIIGNGSKKFKKECPGLDINMNFVRQITTVVLQCMFKYNGLYLNRKIDGIWGKYSQAGLDKFNLLVHEVIQYQS